MEVTFCKLPKGEGESYFRVQVEWCGDSISRITVLDNETVWVGMVSTAEINAVCEQLTSKLSTMTVENWMKETKRALASHGGSKDFKYLLQNKKFEWMKLISPGIKIKFGRANLESVPTVKMIECMIDQAIDLNSNLQIQVKNLEDCKRNLESENQTLLHRLLTYQSEKVEMEKSLYSNFIEVLNAKKARIDLLQKQLDECLYSAPSTSNLDNVDSVSNESFDREAAEPVVVKVKCTVRKKPIKAVISQTKSKAMSIASEKIPDQKSKPNKQQKTKNSSKASTNTSASMKRNLRSAQSTTVQKTATSGIKYKGNYSESPNHYDSDTDVDSVTDNENGDLFGTITSELHPSSSENLFTGTTSQIPGTTLLKRMKEDKTSACIDMLLNTDASDNLFDEIGTQIQSTLLPKRVKQGKSGAHCDVLLTSAHDRTSCSPPPMHLQDAKSKREAERDNCTQKLLDDLGI